MGAKRRDLSHPRPLRAGRQAPDDTGHGARAARRRPALSRTPALVRASFPADAGPLARPAEFPARDANEPGDRRLEEVSRPAHGDRLAGGVFRSPAAGAPRAARSQGRLHPAQSRGCGPVRAGGRLAVAMAGRTSRRIRARKRRWMASLRRAMRKNARSAQSFSTRRPRKECAIGGWLRMARRSDAIHRGAFPRRRWAL